VHGSQQFQDQHATKEAALAKDNKAMLEALVQRQIQIAEIMEDMVSRARFNWYSINPGVSICKAPAKHVCGLACCSLVPLGCALIEDPCPSSLALAAESNAEVLPSTCSLPTGNSAAYYAPGH